MNAAPLVVSAMDLSCAATFNLFPLLLDDEGSTFGNLLL